MKGHVNPTKPNITGEKVKQKTVFWGVMVENQSFDHSDTFTECRHKTVS